MSFHSAQETIKPVQTGLPTYNVQDLTKDGDKAHIVLGDQTYLLRITRAGKLILTK